uniref:Uncharacterized protein n=1 Tax=Lotus japonicus TaxID=34305 RepID=I3T0P9_LOTJA|nr:unknown [Lotus japonicus]
MPFWFLLSIDSMENQFHLEETRRLHMQIAAHLDI